MTREEFIESIKLDRIWGVFLKNAGGEELVAFALVIKNRESAERNLCGNGYVFIKSIFII